MAKQKKRKKKRHIRISKKSKTLFSLLILPTFVISYITLLLSSRIFYGLVKLLFNKDALYCGYLFNDFTIVLAILLLIGILFAFPWHSKATSLRIEFKEYFSGKNEKANKQIKQTIIAFIILCVLFVTFTGFQISTRIVATTDCITEYHLAMQDTEISYNEIQSAKVEYRKDHVPLRAGSSLTTYYIVITIKVNDSEIEFYEDSFNNNYSNIISFLNCVDRNKITIDKTNTENTAFFAPKDKVAFNEIFQLD
ncbi:MAG: hypothetical protein K2F65_02660 [Eubacterium sp.]|nr:hypothetical protein [Eubacterium sp.]